MEIFWRLVLGHLIGDFTLQTNYIAAWKRRNIWGLMAHCGIHPIIYAVLCARYLNSVWMEVGPIQLTGTTCIFIIFITHLIEDEWRIWSVLKKGAPDNTFFYLWDQVIHYAVLFAISPVVEGATSKFGILYYPPIANILAAELAPEMGVWDRFINIVHNEQWVFVGMLLVIVTHFTTVTIYFIEKDFFGGDYPAPQEKYISMAERLLVMSCFLLPGLWMLSVVAVWLARAFIYKVRRVYNFSWTSILIGNITAVFCGLIARAIIY